jgi:signal transduction histidine kinase/DNA-binding NarL/FixJ family response regulator
MAVNLARRLGLLFAPQEPGTWDLQLDVQESERRKRERLVRLNTLLIPRLRVVGFALMWLGVLLHNLFAAGDASWTSWARLTAALAVYCGATWYLLHLFFADLRRYLDLGVVFLAADMWVFALAIYATGAERSWVFFLPLFRVVDQTTTSLRRTLAFAHLAPLAYATVLLYVMLVDGRSVPIGPEVAKLIIIYIGGLYIAFIGRPAGERFRRTTAVIRFARRLIGELEQKSQALESSSRELEASVERQAKLAAENAELYAASQHETLRQSQILNSTSDGIIFVSHDGRIEAANVRAGDLLGFDSPSVIGVEMARLVSRLYVVGDGDSFLPTLHALLEDAWVGGQGDLLQPATGRVLHWVAQPARDGRGGSAGLTFTFLDVTPARELVRQLEDKSRLLDVARKRAEDANRAKGEFLANVSHEIRTPLSAIIGMAQHMLDSEPKPEMIRRIRGSAESLMAIIGDILDFSKIESRKLTLDRLPFALRETLHDTIDTLHVHAAEKNLALAFEVLPEVPDALVGDTMRLRQVLVNLIGNAIKFTDKGEVRLRVGVATELPAQVCLHFAVIDTGIGIPREKQDVVFEAFAQADGSATRRYGGTGLGLSISARLVELMGGDIWVESEAGQGAAFRFTAQFGVQHVSPAAAAAYDDRGSDVPERRGPLTVLVVEDEDVHRELVAALLSGRGHRAITARNGKEALIELARHKVDVALMDLQMPQMDGFEATATIREWERTAGGHLPIIAMTASALGDDPDRCEAAGMDRFLSKPVRRDLLFQLIEELSGTGTPSDYPPELAGRTAFLAGLNEDVVLARKLVDLFIGQSPRLLGEIRTAIDTGDADGLRRAAHTLKGTISNFPSGPARGVAARMEMIGFDGDLQAARDVYPMLEQEVERLKTLLPALI